MAVKDIEVEKKALAKEYKELLKISYQTLSGDDKKLILQLMHMNIKEEYLVRHIFFIPLL